VLKPVHETTAEEFRRVTEVAYLGYVNGTLAALARMRTRNRGTIVQVGSGLAYRAIPLQATYCAAKHAIHGFTDALRCELLHEGSAIEVTMVQLPGLNTPQFDQVLTNLPKKPRPVAPVYQPEVAAKAIVWASEHPRREVWVGGVTPAMIWADRFVPGLVDWYLAKTGFKAQQDDEPLEPDRRSYLWEPVPGDRGAHGRFDDEAKNRSVQLEVVTHRGAALAGAAAAGVTAAAMRWAKRRGPR
jgi:short-subunit dehydrogenase